MLDGKGNIAHERLPWKIIFPLRSKMEKGKVPPFFDLRS